AGLTLTAVEVFMNASSGGGFADNFSTEPYSSGCSRGETYQARPTESSHSETRSRNTGSSVGQRIDARNAGSREHRAKNLLAPLSTHRLSALSGSAAGCSDNTHSHTNH